MNPVPDSRVRLVHDLPPRAEGDYVLYWMVACRRPHWNFGLDRAIAWCRKLGRPLLVLEALRVAYPWASVRLHRFVLTGMGDNAARFDKAGITYHPYVEPEPGAGHGLVHTLAKKACVTVTDAYPAFFLPRMLQAQEGRFPSRLEAVDSNGLLPLSATERTFPTAYAFRRFLQKTLPDHLLVAPSARPLHSPAALRGAPLPAGVARRWPAASAALLRGDVASIARLPLDTGVGPAAIDGGYEAADAQAKKFLTDSLRRYADDRNHPDDDASSGLSPWLHFGHISAHAVFAHLAEAEHWEPTRLDPGARGAKEGFWGMSSAAEAFLDELVTWRELGYNRCQNDPEGYDRYESLPDWAKKTLAEHTGDKRPQLYDLATLEAAETDDPVWNAAQRQIVREGRLHNYLRMLWGKNVLTWSATPQEAVAHLIELNNKYGVDGRDPNSYSGIFWVFGRYDRPWPEHPIFGKVRMMTSASTLRKLRMRRYMQTFAA